MRAVHFLCSLVACPVNVLIRFSGRLAPGRYMVTNETLNHKNRGTGEPQGIGLGWLDDSMQLTGESAEDRAKL